MTQDSTSTSYGQEADRRKATADAHQRILDDLDFQRRLREQQQPDAVGLYGDDPQLQGRRLPIFNEPSSSEVGVVRDTMYSISRNSLNLNQDYIAAMDRIFEIRKTLELASGNNSAALNQELTILSEKTRAIHFAALDKAEAEVEQMFGKTLDQASRQAGSGESLKTHDGRSGFDVLAEERVKEITSSDQRWANRTPPVGAAAPLNGPGASEEAIIRGASFSLTTQSLNANAEYRDLRDKIRDVREALVGGGDNKAALSRQLGELEDRSRTLFSAASYKAETEVERMFGKTFEQASKQAGSGQSLKTVDGRSGLDVLADGRIKEIKSWDQQRQADGASPADARTPVAAAVQQAYPRPEGLHGPFTAVVPPAAGRFVYDVEQTGGLRDQRFTAAANPPSFTLVDPALAQVDDSKAQPANNSRLALRA